jgi:KUP system potassium uptake protein
MSSSPTAKTPALTLAALGIVFGDIGTSPLYTLKECTHAEHGVPPNVADNVLGVLSLIVWSLMLVVTVKYLLFIMRADNQGEGGILALLALVPEKLRTSKAGGVGLVAVLVIAGAALLYGDGMITPAISVLSAVEGIDVSGNTKFFMPILDKTIALKDLVVPITCVILFGLFSIQRRGTGTVGRLFGPVMLLWFGTIGALGAWHMSQNTQVLHALDPRYGVAFFSTHGLHGVTVLASVVLAVTGGEALYADMGHFGAKPIRIAWIAIVFPSLILAYFGQGALVLANPDAAANPFFAMVPTGTATYAMVALATVATIIASQALISGAFSLTHQAVQLGFFPRVTVKHSSHETEGQIYVPEINWLLAAACIALVVAFKSSSSLAAAYGIAVTGTMAITSVVYFVVARYTWGWSLPKAGALLVFFLAFDLPFFGANLTKIIDGGYVPILVGAAFFATMVIWKRGRRFLSEVMRSRTKPLDVMLKTKLERTDGTAIVMCSIGDGVPPIIAHHATRVHALPKHVVLLTILFEHVPHVPSGKRTKVEALGSGFHRVVGRYGFMETPAVPALLDEAKANGLEAPLDDVTYFLGRETILAQPGGKMGEWEEGFFAFLSRNSRPATSYFNLPPEQVVEIGTQIDL